MDLTVREKSKLAGLFFIVKPEYQTRQKIQTLFHDFPKPLDIQGFPLIGPMPHKDTKTPRPKNEDLHRMVSRRKKRLVRVKTHDNITNAEVLDEASGVG